MSEDETVYIGDLLDLRAGRMLCADPTDVAAMDTLLGDIVPRTAIIDPPNGRVGRDLLTYLATLGVKTIICWRADLYPGTISLYRRGTWVVWDYDPHAWESGSVYTTTRMCYVYGDDLHAGRHPLILRIPDDDTKTWYGRQAVPSRVTGKLLERAQAESHVLICYDPSGGNAADVCQDTLSRPQVT